MDGALIANLLAISCGRELPVPEVLEDLAPRRIGEGAERPRLVLGFCHVRYLAH